MDHGFSCWGDDVFGDGPSTFSLGGSCCSTPSQPQSASNDGADTSGTHPGDTDEDSDEGTYDDEGQYESNNE